MGGKGSGDISEIGDYYVDKKLRNKWSILSSACIQKDEDRVYIVAGKEREGKSLAAMQFACFIDKTFTIDRICFTPEEFLYQVKHAPKGSVVIFDEAFRGLSSRGAMSKINKQIVTCLTESGQRCLVVFIVLPSVFMLDRYISMHRSNGLFYIHRNKQGKRGFWRYFSPENTRLLLKLGKDTQSYSKPFVRIHGKFYGRYPPQIIEEIYRKKKLDSLRESEIDVGGAMKSTVMAQLGPYYFEIMKRLVAYLHTKEGGHWKQTFNVLNNNLYIKLDRPMTGDWITDAKKDIADKKIIDYTGKAIKKARGVAADIEISPDIDGGNADFEE